MAVFPGGCICSGLKLRIDEGTEATNLLVTEKVAARCSQVVLCNSESMRSEALALGIAPAGKLRVLGDGSSNGVDLRKFSPGPTDVRERLGISAAAPIVGFVGRLTEDKGGPNLSEALMRSCGAFPRRICCWWDGLMRQKMHWTRPCESESRIIPASTVRGMWRTLRLTIGRWI